MSYDSLISLEQSSNIIELNENDIKYIDDLIVGFIYIKRKRKWKKKFFVQKKSYMEYWKSYKMKKNKRIRVKECYFHLEDTFELSCIKKIIYKNKVAWTFKLYKKDHLFLSFLSFNNNIHDIYNNFKDYLNIL